DIVTAQGELLTASDEEHQDLFFGIRGGGGNFGVATSFEYRLHRLDHVVGGMVWHPIERAVDVLRFFRDWTSETPDELGAILFFLSAARAPQVPESLQGQPIVA